MSGRGSAAAHLAAQRLELLRSALRLSHHASPCRVLEACAAALRVAPCADPEDTLDACLARFPLLPQQLPALARDPPGGGSRDVVLHPVARLTATAAGALVAEALPPAEAPPPAASLEPGAPPLVVVLGRTVGLLEWHDCRNPDNLFALAEGAAALGDGARARRDRGRPCALSPLRPGQALRAADGRRALTTTAAHALVHEGVDDEGLVAWWLVLEARPLPDADLHVHRRALTAYAPLSAAQVARALAHSGRLLALAPPWARARRTLVELALRTAPAAMRHAAPALRRGAPAGWWRRAGAAELRFLLRRCGLDDDAARLVARHALAPPLDPAWAWPPRAPPPGGAAA